MSNCYCDYDPPSVFSATTRRAKKDYKCCDCNAAISKGERYLYVFGVWEGEASSFRMCELCGDMRNQCEFACLPFGDLFDGAYQYDCKQDPMDVAAFKKRYEANR